VALNINPFLISAYNLRGIIKLRQGESREALNDFEAGLKVEPDNLNLLMNSGIANINLKEYDKSVADFDKLLSYDKRNIGGILYRGIAYVERGDTAKAISEFERATQLNRYSPDAYTYLGMMHYQTKQFEKALEDYNHLAELRPKDAYVYINRAITKYYLDDYRGCMSDIDFAISLDPNNVMAYANRAMLRAEFGDTNNAVEDYTKVLSINPSDDISLFNRAILYIQIGQLNNALSDLNIIIAKHPEFGPAYYQRAIVKRQQGDMKGSELDYMTAYTFEQERIKRGLENGEKAESETAQAEQDKKDGDKKKSKKSSRSKNDNDIKKYDQMVVVSDFGDNDDKLQQDNKETIRGRVQDRDIAIDMEPVFELSFFTNDTILPKARYYARSVEEFNNKKISERPLVITNREYVSSGNNAALSYFNKIRDISAQIDRNPENIDLYMERGTMYNLVLNYNNAINDFNVCILKNPKDVNAYFNRASTRYKMVEMLRSLESESTASTSQLGQQQMKNEITILDYDLIMNDLKRVTELSPSFEFAYYNISLIQCIRKQYNEALESLTQAIYLNNEFAEAYFNRGIIKIYLGDEDSGAADLSRAGELGIYKAYNVIKRYTEQRKNNE
jgi:tetratricopeptide (TPR) repeat protein